MSDILTTERQPESDRTWAIETNGINPITANERHGKPFELFWIWFAGNIGILGVVYGGLLVAAKLNLWQSIFVALFASVISFALVGILSLPGVRGGAPMLTLSRAVFGPRGNIGPTIISWLSFVGWETTLVVTATYALLGLFALVHIPSNPFWTVVGLVIVAGLVVLFGLLGHATLVWIQRAATWLFGILTLVIVAVLVGKVNWAHVLAAPAGPWDTGLLASFIVIMAGTGIGWINAGSDYTRYLPLKTKGNPIIFWTVFGSTLPLFVLMLVGVLTASLLPTLPTASNPIQVIEQALPGWMTVPYLVTAIGGLIVAADLDIYSSGLNLLAMGIKAPRYATVMIDGVLMTAGAIYVTLVAQNFYGPFVSFLLLLADGLLAWAGIFLVDMIWRRNYDPASLTDTSSRSRYFYQGGFNIVACVSWIVGVVVGLLFTSSPFFNGPFATGLFASTSLGYIVGAAVSAVLYLVLTLITNGNAQAAQVTSGSEAVGGGE